MGVLTANICQFLSTAIEMGEDLGEQEVWLYTKYS